MKTNSFFRKTAAMVAVVSLGFAFSCQENEDPLGAEASYIAEESLTDVYFEDVDDLAGLAVASDEGTNTGGRVADGPRDIIIGDSRCECENVTVTITFTPNSSDEVPVGDIVIDFGEGCEDDNGNVRKGKILIHFVGKRFMPESTIVTNFEGYSINGIALDGTRTLTNISGSTNESPKFKVQLADGTAIWPDGTEATREHCFEREWIRALNPLMDQLIVNQCGDASVAASGTNRRGVGYTMEIVEELVYKRGCPIAVAGVKKFTNVSTGKSITVEYGDGACDNIITISVDGTSRSINVRR